MEGLGLTIGVLAFLACGLLAASRIVIPGFMRCPLAAYEALRLRPLDAAARANAACPKCVPHGSAWMEAFPPVFRLRPPFAVRTMDFGLALHRAASAPNSAKPQIDQATTRVAWPREGLLGPTRKTAERTCPGPASGWSRRIHHGTARTRTCHLRERRNRRTAYRLLTRLRQVPCCS